MLGIPSVEQSIIELLNTPVGSKFFLPEYGSRVSELLFEPNDDVLDSLLDAFIFQAVGKWETRVKMVSTESVRLDEYVAVTITYRVMASNEINSFVYPFYSQIKY